MDAPIIGGAVLFVLFLGGLFWAYAKGKAAQKSSQHKARAEDEKAKSEALEEANAHSPNSVRDRLRKLAGRRR